MCIYGFYAVGIKTGNLYPPFPAQHSLSLPVLFRFHVYATKRAVRILFTLRPCRGVTARLEATGHENKYFFMDILLTDPLLIFCPFL